MTGPHYPPVNAPDPANAQPPAAPYAAVPMPAVQPAPYFSSAHHVTPTAARRGPGWWVISLAVVAVLLASAAVVQEVVIQRGNRRMAHQAAALAAEQSARGELGDELTSLRKRVATLEKATKGSINASSVAALVRPSVVRVSTGRSTGSAFAFGTTGSGTRFITNVHVVEDVVASGGKSVTIERGDESFPATIVKVDKARDLAVLLTSAKFPLLLPAPSLPEPGSPVVVVGSPLGIEDSVTAGVVSAVRPRPGSSSEKQIQIDAPVSPGNSGGPVVDADGKVLGVVQQKIVGNGAEGLAFAIPVSEVCTVAGC